MESVEGEKEGALVVELHNIARMSEMLVGPFIRGWW